jgi:hypothetical protein
MLIFRLTVKIGMPEGHSLHQHCFTRHHNPAIGRPVQKKKTFLHQVFLRMVHYATYKLLASSLVLPESKFGFPSYIVLSVLYRDFIYSSFIT